MAQFLEALTQWGVDTQRIQEAPEELLYALTRVLGELGVDIRLATIAIRTPHPQLDMLVFRWRPLGIGEVPTDGTKHIGERFTTTREDGVQDTYFLVHGHMQEKTYLQSPFRAAIDRQEVIRIRLHSDPDEGGYPIASDLLNLGMTDYVAVPLPSGAHTSVALSLATAEEDGFSEAFVADFCAFVPLLCLSVAYKVERLQFREVLQAYIGKEPASLVLAGQMKRGDLISRHAVLGFADLRGFTSTSETMPVDSLLELIGQFFEFVYNAVCPRGGEILKFMGDGVLFMLPHRHDDAGETCDLALDALTDLIRSVARHNEARRDAVMRFGCALHYDEVMYGNIGSPSRLDFTVVGPAVNLTARLESLCSAVDQQCLLSQAFAGLTTWDTRPVGAYDLKGIGTRQVVFAPVLPADGSGEVER